MNKELLSKLRYKKVARKRLKWEQVTKKGYRDTVQASGYGVRKAKAILEINMVKDMRSNKKGFFTGVEGRLGKMWAGC